MSDILTTRDGLVGTSPRYAGFVTPPWKRYLQDDSGAAINLTGVPTANFTLTLVNQSNPLRVKTGAGIFTIVSPASQGLISYQYSPTDVADAGNWFQFLTVQLPNELTPRVFDPQLIEIYAFAGGLIVAIQDVNITEVNGLALSSGNPVPINAADGAIVTIGTTTDSSSANTQIGLLKAIKAYLAGTLTTAGTVTEANSASILASVGGVADAAWSGSGNGSEIAILKKLVAQLAANLGMNITQIGGSAPSASNPLYTLQTAVSGYVAAYGSNPSALTSSTDAAFKWGAGGTTVVNHVMISNNSSANVNWDLDVATTAGSPVLAPGQSVFLDVQTTAVHLQSSGTPNINGSSGSNVIVRGWL